LVRAWRLSFVEPAAKRGKASSETRIEEQSSMQRCVYALVTLVSMIVAAIQR
jgi:hypothetical protein